MWIWLCDSLFSSVWVSVYGRVGVWLWRWFGLVVVCVLGVLRCCSYSSSVSVFVLVFVIVWARVWGWVWLGVRVWVGDWEWV